ncbi:MAG TPA: PEP-CTERM sorting domain-containing protein [Pirellulales bacterium]|jgi:hypothetical protein
MHKSFVVLLSLAVFLYAARSHAHEDVLPYGLDGKIATGGHDDVLGTNNITQRVFGYDFGEDPSDPFIIGDPGFNNGAFAIGLFPNDGLLPPNFTLGLNVLTNLSFWDGAGAVSFAPSAAGVDLGLTRGSNTVHISGAGLTGITPTIGSTVAAGRLHVHTTSTLNFTDGTNPLAPNAPDGVYLFGLELTLTGSGLAKSDPIYFVFNNGVSEETHDTAIEWAQNNLVVPEPSTWVLLSLGLLLAPLVARKRHASTGKAN